MATPATATSCTYFWGSARNPDLDDDAACNRITSIQGEVFAEDVVVLEAQQRQIERMPDRRLRVFAVDAGDLRARRMLDRMQQANARPRR